jgi:hypothetical protein
MIDVNRKNCKILSLMQKIKLVPNWAAKVMKNAFHTLVILGLEQFAPLSEVPSFKMFETQLERLKDGQGNLKWWWITWQNNRGTRHSMLPMISPPPGKSISETR